jgi:hypothetical protein
MKLSSSLYNKLSNEFFENKCSNLKFSINELYKVVDNIYYDTTISLITLESRGQVNLTIMTINDKNTISIQKLPSLLPKTYTIYKKGSASDILLMDKVSETDKSFRNILDLQTMISIYSNRISCLTAYPDYVNDMMQNYVNTIYKVYDKFPYIIYTFLVTSLIPNYDIQEDIENIKFYKDYWILFSQIDPIYIQTHNDILVRINELKPLIEDMLNYTFVPNF